MKHPIQVYFQTIAHLPSEPIENWSYWAVSIKGYELALSFDLDEAVETAKLLSQDGKFDLTFNKESEALMARGATI